jgi:hypothetical protein
MNKNVTLLTQTGHEDEGRRRGSQTTESLYSLAKSEGPVVLYRTTDPESRQGLVSHSRSTQWIGQKSDNM